MTAPEAPAPEIPEGVETVEIRPAYLGLKPYVLIEVTPEESSSRLDVSFGGGVDRLAALRLMAETVARSLDDLAASAHSHDHPHPDADEEPVHHRAARRRTPEEDAALGDR